MTKLFSRSAAPLLLLLWSAPLVSQPRLLRLDSPELVQQGAGLFAKSCAVGYCHGSEGRAARGPALRERVWDPHELYRITAHGLPGTSMPAWSGILPEEQIWAVTAYVLSLSDHRPGELTIELGGEQGAPPPKPVLSGLAQRGEALFADLTREKRCSLCHELGERGASIGPNLLQAARGKSEEELRQALLEPGASIAYGFEATVVATEAGETIRGVLEERTDEFVRIYDAAALPPPLRTLYDDQIANVETEPQSLMPSATELGYSSEEVDALVAYLQSL